MYRKRMPSWLKHIDFSILDLVLMQAAFWLASITRNGIDFFPYGNPVYMNSALILTLVSFIAGILMENYKNILKRDMAAEFLSVIRTVAIAVLTVVVYLFFVQDSSIFSRIVILVFSIYSTVLLFFGRTLWKRVLARYGTDKKNRKKLLLVSDTETAGNAVDMIKNKAFREYDLVGLVLLGPDAEGKTEYGGAQIVAGRKDMLAYLQSHWVDEVLICLADHVRQPRKLMDSLAEMGITTHYVIGQRTGHASEQTIEKVAGFTCLTESIRIASLWQLACKRLMDIAGALAGLIITGILFVFVAPAIYLSDPGPVFYSQTRIGQNGRPFKLYKFRSMYQDADLRKAELMAYNSVEDGMMFKMENDPRILGSGPDGTRHGIGWFIRKTSIDEFPQFYNVLKGDLSLVGTRPPLEEEVRKYKLHHYARLSIRPGITGLWQVSGRSSITDFEEVVALDLEYINTWTIRKDIQIILKTVAIVFTGEGAK